VTEAVLSRLSTYGIQLLAEGQYCLFARDGFVALVERRAGGFGTVGGAGLLTEAGPAYLVWRDGQAWFVNKLYREPAAAGQVALLRGFSADLEAALSGA